MFAILLTPRRAKAEERQNERFSEYIAGIRRARGFSLRGMAKRLGISAAYYSDLEKERRKPPATSLLARFAAIAELTAPETARLLDLAAAARGAIPPDISDYLQNCPGAIAALRLAMTASAGPAEWEGFVRLILQAHPKTQTEVTACALDCPLSEVGGPETNDQNQD